MNRLLAFTLVLCAFLSTGCIPRQVTVRGVVLENQTASLHKGNPRIQGRPITGVYVSFTLDSENNLNQRIIGTTHTNSQGQFELTFDAPLGMEFVPSKLEVKAAGQRHATFVDTVLISGDTEITIYLVPGFGEQIRPDVLQESLDHARSYQQ